jgi:predicted DsbA family dithiol-disulfide isomerase
VQLATEVGLEPDGARAALIERRHRTAVAQDASTAQLLGATGVPFFVVDRKYGAAGAQPADLLLQMLERAWADSHPHLTELARSGSSRSTVPAADGCDDDSCAV